MSGIWDNEKLSKFNDIPQHRFDLGEGKTPIISLKVDEQRILVKDENANPTGSFKDRCLAYQISHYYSKGIKSFAISSSGNAAISAGNLVKIIPDINLDIYISNNINPEKINKLMDLNSKRIKIIQCLKPKSDAIINSRKNNQVNLRASADEYALIGYKTIAYELENEAKSSDGIFIPTSSGTAALGIALGFKDLGIEIPIYLCQTTKIFSIASEYDSDFTPTKTSIADAIVDRVALRKRELIRVINDSNGDAFVLSDEMLYIAKEKLQMSGKKYSFNSLLSLAGFLKAKAKGVRINNPIILASGL
jgi:threonine synthase